MIDFAVLADAYRERLRREQQATTPLMLALILAVERMDTLSKKLDEQTAGWPIFLYRGDALTVWVAVPAGASEAPPNFGERVGAAATRAIEGTKLVTSAWDHAVSLRRVTSTLAALVKAIEDSVSRHATVTPDLFEPAGKTASDLFGQGALIVRTALSDKKAIAAAGHSAFEAWLIWGLFGGRTKPAPPPGATPPESSSLNEQLVELVQVEVMATTVLPGLALLVRATALGSDHLARTLIVQTMVVTEDSLHELRVKAVMKLIPGNAVWEYLYATDWVLRHNLTALLGWIPLAAERFLSWLAYTLEVITQWGKAIAWWVRAVLNAKRLADFLDNPLARIIYELGGALPGPDFSALKSLPPFPDLDPDILHGTLKTKIETALDTRRDQATKAITDGATGVGTQLAALGTTVEGLGPTLARSSRAKAMAADADKLTAQLMGGELAAPPDLPDAKAFGAIAGAVDQLVLGAGGFELVGRLIPRFLEEAGRTWQDLGAVPHPTSPHVLAKHGRLAAVHVPEVSVRAGLDDPERVAAELRTALSGAYSEGRRRFEALEGAAR